MFEIPHSKHQIPNKFQTPNANLPSVGFRRAPGRAPGMALRVLNLVLGICLVFGIWSLEFGCGTSVS
jgi:hypothetical protein